MGVQPAAGGTANRRDIHGRRGPARSVGRLSVTCPEDPVVFPIRWSKVLSRYRIRRGAVAEVVVTGSAGFIGQHLIERLLVSGHRVVGIDRRPAQPRAGLTLVLADLLDPVDAVQEPLRAADLVFHLAARSGVRDRHPMADALRERDTVSTAMRVLDLVPAATPLVVTSSSSVYGGSPHGMPCRERDRLRPIGGYGRSKLAVERWCARRAAIGGAVTVCRPFTVVGEGQRPDMAVALWINALRRDEPMELFGPSARKRDLTDVRDVADCLVQLAERGVSGTVNIGTGIAHTVHDIAATAARVMGRPPRFEVRPAPSDDPLENIADTTTLSQVIGRSLHTDLTDVIARQVAATVDAPLLAGSGR